jgi:hypothetical protein
LRTDPLTKETTTNDDRDALPVIRGIEPMPVHRVSVSGSPMPCRFSTVKPPFVSSCGSSWQVHDSRKLSENVTRAATGTGAARRLKTLEDRSWEALKVDAAW